MEGKKKEESLNQGSNLARINRNMIERKRRTHMKDLFTKLFNLLPTAQNSKLSLPDLLEQATIYTTQLQEKIEKMRERKQVLLNGEQEFEPVIDIKYSLEHSTLEVIIICESKKNLMLHQVISVLEEEGAEAVSTTYHNVGDRVFCTVYSQAISSRIGIETARVDERLKKLIIF